MTFGLHNQEFPFSAGDFYNKNIVLQMGHCPVRHVFEDALAALEQFERAEINKVVFKPNGNEVYHQN